MKILITGVNGFIGNHLRNHFQGEHEIYTITRTHASNVPVANECQIDLSDVKLVKANFTTSTFKENIDVIIHCAAKLSATDHKDIEIFYQNNAITESMIHIAGITKVAKFINFSTIGVYPNITGTYNEYSAIEPSVNHECLYSLSKVCSEELLKFYLKDNTKVINLRLGQVYGPGMREDRIFMMMREELKNDNKITVFGNGERVSNFVTIDYLVRKLDQIIKNNNLQGTFNLGERNLSYYNLAEIIIKQFGNSSSEIVLKESGVRSKVIIDSSKLAKL